MKPVKLIVVLFVFITFQKTFADIIPDNTHYVDICAKITNIDNYENLKLLAYIKALGYTENNYEILQTACLTKGYRDNILEIYAVHDSNLVDKDIATIDLPKANYALKSNINIDPYIGYVPDSIPMVSVQEFYQIMGFTENSVVLHLYKKITQYNDGKSDLVEEFTYHGDVSALSQTMPLDVKSRLNVTEFSVFPNPPVNNLFINAKSHATSINVNLYTVQGTKMVATILSKKVSGENFILPVTGFKKGVYLLEIGENNRFETHKIVIK